MAQLPADRTKLAQAQSNMAPSFTASSQKLKDALTEAYDTVDLLNQKVNDHGSATTLPHADKSVIRAKLADKAVGAGQLDDSAVGQSHHQDNGIPSRALPDNVILQRHMSDNSVGSAEIQAGAVTATKIPNGTINSQHIDAALLASSASLATQAEFDKRGVSIQNFANLVSGDNWLPAFQAAIDAASLGVGAVWIPQGVFTVTLTPTTFIYLKNNVTIDGVGTIKVKDNNGNFLTMFGQDNAQTLKNVTIRNISIDQNTSLNTSGFIDPTVSNSYQNIVCLTNFDGVLIENVKFNPCSGVNTVNLNGQGCKNAIVRNNYFRFVRGTGVVKYDNSAVYFNCENHKAYGNTFEAVISDKAFGAIETHNGLSVIENNTTIGYQTGVNIVTESTNQTKSRNRSSITVNNNTIAECNHGIMLWSMTNKVLTDVTVVGNTVSVANVKHNENSCSGIKLLFETTSGEWNGAFDGVNISGNTVTFEDEGSTGRGGQASSEIYGIGLSPNGDVSNALVTGNVVVNAPAKGICIGTRSATAKSVNVKVSDNLIVNAGQNPQTTFQRAGIFLELTAHENTRVSDNYIIDTFSPMRGYQSIYAKSPGTFKNVAIRDNFMNTKQGGYLYNVAPGLGIDEGDQLKTKFSTFPPTVGSFDVGDIVVNTSTITPGKSFSHYRCTRQGTYGTLTGITLDIASASDKVTLIGDTTALNVGDWLLPSGQAAPRKILYMSGNYVELSGQFTATAGSIAVNYYGPPLLKPISFVGPVLKGATASRPTGLGADDAGIMYFDTTLVATNGKPIWWNGAAWVDNAGAVV